MKESAIEAKLRDGIRALGGRAYKFVSPGNAGVPDRMVVLPGGRIIFVELKTEAGRLSKMQTFQIAQLRAMGCDARVLYGAEAVQRFLAECEERGDSREVPTTRVPAVQHPADH